jgi:hypothetical protein
MQCISLLPVSMYGDRDHRFGYAYDERDGTGLDHRPALAVDRSAGRPDYMFLEFDLDDSCQSAPTRPGTPGSPGTADPARAAQSSSSVRTRVRQLARKLEDLEHRTELLDRMSERFDEWESCLSWAPVTEYGDPDGRYGFMFEGAEAPSGHLPAISIDYSEWDDPDYEFLVFAGRDRPFVHRECGNEPGEEVDRRPVGRPGSVTVGRTSRTLRSPVWTPPRVRLRNNAAALHDRLADIRDDASSVFDDAEDLREPVDEFDVFDQCAYLLGLTEHGTQGESGFAFAGARTAETQRSALAMDMRSLELPEHQILAYPGEEPPSIECNEDASGRPDNAQ